MVWLTTLLDDLWCLYDDPPDLHYGRDWRSRQHSLLDIFADHAEKTINLLVGSTLIQLHIEGANSEGTYARLSYRVEMIDGRILSKKEQEEKSVTFEAKIPPTSEEQQMLLEKLLDRCNLSSQRVIPVSDEYVVGHLRAIKLQNAIQQRR